jgi:thymidylate synthase ThyX
VYEAKILLDSISPSGHRLTTFEITFPRIILAEFNTHRMISRNAASSRAIPLSKMIKQVQEDPFIPIWWGKNQPGMSAFEEIEDKEEYIAKWLLDSQEAIYHAEQYAKIHKSIPNRLLEPWMWTTVICTATEWENFFYLRQDESILPNHIDSVNQLFNPQFPAEPHMQIIACMMRLHYRASTPTLRQPGEWHLPLVDGYDVYELVVKGEVDNKELAKISTGRCARVSYLTHEGKRDPIKDIELHDSLLTNYHMSPFEHAAKVPTNTSDIQLEWCGNFRGWIQYRKMIPGENQTKPREIGDKRG